MRYFCYTFTSLQLVVIYIFLGIIVVSFIYTLVYLIVQKKVKSISELYLELLRINANYIFHKDIPKIHRHYVKCNSKRQFEQFNYHKYFQKMIDDKMHYYQPLMEKIKENEVKYKEYGLECGKLSSSITIEDAKKVHLPYKFVIYFEKHLLRKYMHKPILGMAVKITASYTSPKGEKRYKNSKVFEDKSVRYVYKRTLKLLEEKETRKYQMNLERVKMSKSLRYDILKRDGFKCQICGRAAKDGVKLHVDHILAVAKGGKTEKSNLRTLCDICNQGKSDKDE